MSKGNTFPRVKGYDITETIGSGGFSVVYKALTKASPKEIVAVKALEKSGRNTFADDIIKEISLLKSLKHKHIVKLIDFFWEAKYIFIIMEYCDGGDLSQYIRRSGKLTEPVVKTVMQQLALAFRFLRGQRICHMDLKPSNMLLVFDPDIQIKVSDFGLSDIVSSKRTDKSPVGSLLYMAPEKIANQRFGAKVDLWSIGIILYECLVGFPPGISLNAEAFIDFISKKSPIKLPSNIKITKECHSLLQALLKYDPNERIGFEEFFNHRFIDLKHSLDY